MTRRCSFIRHSNRYGLKSLSASRTMKDRTVNFSLSVGISTRTLDGFEPFPCASASRLGKPPVIRFGESVTVSPESNPYTFQQKQLLLPGSSATIIGLARLHAFPCD
jgi:hypothetical protein